MGVRPVKGLRAIGFGIDFNNPQMQLLTQQAMGKGLEFINPSELKPGAVDVMLLHPAMTADGLEKREIKFSIRDYLRHGYCRFFVGGDRLLQHLVRTSHMPSLARGEQVGEIYRSGVIIITHMETIVADPDAFEEVATALEDCRLAAADVGEFAIKMTQDDRNALQQAAGKGGEAATRAWTAWQAADASDLLTHQHVSSSAQSGAQRLARSAVKVAHFVATQRGDCRFIILMSTDRAALAEAGSQKTILAANPLDTVKLLHSIAHCYRKLLRK